MVRIKIATTNPIAAKPDWTELPGTLLGPLGGAIDASVNKNAGAFQMRFVEETDKLIDAAMFGGEEEMGKDLTSRVFTDKKFRYTQNMGGNPSVKVR